MKESKEGYVLVPIWPPFWSLHCRHRLQLYLPIPRIASLARPKEGHCIGAVVEWSFCYVGKKFGVWLFSKLQAILLMEADFNAMSKEVHGVRILDNARQYKLIPKEISASRIALPTMGV